MCNSVQGSKQGLVVVQSNVQALQILLGRRQFCPVMCVVHVQAFLSLFGHYCKMAHIPMFLQCVYVASYVFNRSLA